jgi:hypothetical protein
MRAIEFNTSVECDARNAQEASDRISAPSSTTMFWWACAEGFNGKHYLLIGDDVVLDTVVEVEESDLTRSADII